MDKSVLKCVYMCIDCRSCSDEEIWQTISKATVCSLEGIYSKVSTEQDHSLNCVIGHLMCVKCDECV